MGYVKPYRRIRSRSGPPRPGRWMDLKYSGTCRGCETAIPAGKRAFYDPADKLICCTSIDCAAKFGLTEEKWMGSPVSGRMVTVISEHRTGRPELTWKQRYGRCEDAPACGCCS